MSEIDVTELNKDTKKEKESERERRKKRERKVGRRMFVSLGMHHRKRKKMNACETL